MSDPKIFSVEPDNVRDAIDCAVEALSQGSLVIIPTETVYGLAASPTVPGALERIYEAKSRDAGKPVPLLAYGVEDVLGFGAVMGEEEMALAERFWPGPLTMVLKTTGAKEGFRVPDHEVAKKIIKESGGMLRVTSANVSGEPPALDANAALDSLGFFVDVVVDTGTVEGELPSTVVEVIDGNIKVLREGAIPGEMLL